MEEIQKEFTAVDDTTLQVTYVLPQPPVPPPVVETYTLDQINDRLDELATLDAQSDKVLADAQFVCDSEKAQHVTERAKFTELKEEAVNRNLKTAEELANQ